MSSRKQETMAGPGEDRAAAGRAPAEGGAPAPRGRRTFFDAFRENAEALIVAVVLAIIIRHFAVEAFVIPTGSMAPSLFGMHVWLDCPDCGTEYPVGVASDSNTGELRERFRQTSIDGKTKVVWDIAARCPICHYRYSATPAKDAIWGGYKILVDKFAYFISQPQRFDVIVFQFDQWKNYIKRLVGLPGETVAVFDGDLYVDGKIVRKQLFADVQDGLWRQVSNSDVVERGLNATPAWSEPDRAGSGFWTPQQDRTRWSINHRGESSLAALEYQRGFDNFVAYNLGKEGRESRPAGTMVGDKKLAFTVTPLGGRGWIGAEMRDGDFTFRARLPIGDSAAGKVAVLERVVSSETRTPGEESAAHPSAMRVESSVALAAGTAAAIEFENLDDRVAVRVDGREVLGLDYVSCPDPERPPQPNGTLPQHLRILGRDVQAELRSIRVYQDLYYLERAGPPGTMTTLPIRLGPDEYLALGDNSGQSSDGRVWGAVPGKNLMGKALLVFWPAWPFNFQCKFIR